MESKVIVDRTTRVGRRTSFRVDRAAPVVLAALMLLCACGSQANESRAAHNPKARADAPMAASLAAPATPAKTFRQVDDPGYPRLPERATTARDFVPQGWVLEKSVQGDLNGDGRADLAMVMREKDPEKMLTASEDGGDRDFDTNPYRIAAAFLEADGKTYRLVMENHMLIPRHRNRNLADPFQDLSVRAGSLFVHLSHFANMGGWGAATLKYQFRHQRGAFHLIGYERIDTQRNTGEVETISLNYLTGRVKKGQGTIESDKETVSWSRLPQAPLLRIDQVGNGMTFDPVARRVGTDETE